VIADGCGDRQDAVVPPSTDTAAATRADCAAAPTALYVHVPFCIRRCAYCDFATAPYDDDSARAYVPRLLHELERVPRGAPMRTAYFGGGTPTALHERELERLLAAVCARIAPRAGFEWTCEANPESVTPAKAALLRDHGVNRVSLGAQSFQPAVLAALGRDHAPDHVFRALDTLRAAGFRRLTLDLMFAAPGETTAQLEADLATLAGLGLDHVSAYCLTYEAGTPLTRMRAEGRVTPHEDDVELVQYRLVRERLAAAGLAHYEISNYARPGEESRHNLVYWRGEEYFGLGLGAGSYEHGTRRTNTRLLPHYLGEWGASPFPPHEAETLEPAAKARERAILGLRLRAGLDPRDFTAPRGGTLAELYRDGELESLERRGLLARGDGRIRLTDRGLELADEVFVELV
jgi:oxygen-independent coproporphyrinogen-3 oxidase